MKKLVKVIVCLFFSLQAFAQISYESYPANWWVGMKMNKIQLMFKANNGLSFPDKFSLTTNSKDVKITKINKVENKHYLFVDIEINKLAKPQKFDFVFTLVDSKESFPIPFTLNKRRQGNGYLFAQGVTAKDFMYLILPDRFSNGDVSNDKVAGMKDQSLRRDTVFNRHGGDLKGIQNHLDYLNDLGVTALWLNPVIENDMPDRTEHGYAFTNHYKIEPRLGGDVGYQNLIDATHAKGMKIIQDAVYNHVGLYHFFIQDMPMKDWVHEWPAYTNTTYKDQVIFDPYASTKDKQQMINGWFTKQMPDLNQNNPYVANFLIEHAIWTVENFGIDGWRIDTYAYNDLAFMNNCNKALMAEYPNLTLFGETWVHGVPNQSYFCENNYNIPIKSNLQAVTDFQTLWGITDALTKDFGWSDGVNNLYTTLAQDFVYKDPTRNVIFLDNHDMARFYSTVGENVDKYKTALTWLLTSRGVPQIYYGDELATTGTTSPNDGYVRLDFAGGWPTDTINKFNISGRTVNDQAIFTHIYKLANYRRASPALTTGKFMQFLPEEGVYVYFRYTDKQTVMIVMNTAKEEKIIDFTKYAERTNGFSNYKDIFTKSISPIKNMTIGSYKAAVMELMK
jgi:neopullulanase